MQLDLDDDVIDALIDDALIDDALTDDALTDRVRVWQRRRGHRYSVDDVVTAWTALRARPQLRAHLDLGCGIGSVLLMVADRARPQHAVGIEAQAVSFALAQRNLERNALCHGVTVCQGDIRDALLIERVLAGSRGGFDLVTGTPPYKPLGSATLSPDPQRAHARVELRGGVEVYLQAAARALASGGLFVMCAETALDARVLAGCRASQLAIVERLDVVAMAGRKGRLFSVYSCARAADLEQNTGGPRVEQLVLRDARGARTLAARELRRFFGLHTDPLEAPSPPRSLARPPTSERSSVS